MAEEEREMRQEERRVRARLAWQDTVTWRAGEAVSLQQPPSPAGGGPHQHPEPRREDHHPHCPCHLLAGSPVLEQEVDGGDEEEEAGQQEAVAAAEVEEEQEEPEPEQESYADSELEEYGDGEEEEEEEAATALPLVPLWLLLAKEEPGLEDEDALQEGAPDGLICPISYRLLVEPVNAQDGYTYQRSALEKWVANCQQAGQYPRSPMTNLPMVPLYTPSHTMKSMVGQYIQQRRKQREQEQEQEQEPKGVEEKN